MLEHYNPISPFKFWYLSTYLPKYLIVPIGVKIRSASNGIWAVTLPVKPYSYLKVRQWAIPSVL